MAEQTTKTDFLRFSAYSIKDLITRKLSEDSKYTDQVYEGSNLAILIDIVSYMYQCLLYQLNTAASESMFSDTQIYENMVRLIKFLDYNPRGCSPAQLYLTAQGDLADNSKILPFSYIDTGLTDRNGKKIYFSLVTTDDISTEQSSGSSFDLAVYNGLWKVYSTVFTASGTAYETFTLQNMYSDTDSEKYVSNDHIYVYVYSAKDGRYRRWNLDKNGVFITSKKFGQDGEEKYFTLYGNDSEDDNVYSITLNENHQYEVKFGDGNIGNKLNSGDKVYILYLDTNGEDGQIDIEKVDAATFKLKCNEDIKNLSYEFRKVVYGNETPDEAEEYMQKMADENLYTLSYKTSSSSSPVTEFKAEEDVEDIRANAPNWFKTGYRLITRGDYEYFIKNSSDVRNALKIGSIIDVKCMNNTEVVSKFYKWFYTMGLNRSVPNGRYYFENDFFTRTGYQYIDPSDSNNIFLWIKAQSKMDDEMLKLCTKQLNGSLLNSIKIMTAEIQVMNPVTVNFDICAAPTDYVKSEYFESASDSEFDANCESYIEVTIDDTQVYVGNNIQQQVYDIITQAFNQNYIKLGQSIDSVQMTNQIYQINGVSRVRTVWNQQDSEYVKALDGISFASWSDPDVLDDYEDLTVGNSIRHIEEFQFPDFVGSNLLMNRIKVIKKQLTTVNSLKF